MKIFIEQTDERSISGWATIIWRAVEKNVRRLQERISRATERQQWRQVRNLQKLLARSISLSSSGPSTIWLSVLKA